MSTALPRTDDDDPWGLNPGGLPGSQTTGDQSNTFLPTDPAPAPAANRTAEASGLLGGLAGQYGITSDPGDLASLMDRANYDRFGGNLSLAAQDFAAQYGRRAASQQTGSGVDSSSLSGSKDANYNPTGGSGDILSSLKSKAQQAGNDPAARDSLARDITSQLTAQGHDVQRSGETITIDGTSYTLGGNNDWMPSGKSSYTPGEIPLNDIPNYTYESLMQTMDQPKLDAFVSNLLDHPESLGEREVAMLKAASKDELAEMQLQEQDQISQLGSQYGIQESPWLASEKLASSRANDNAMVQSNRAVDMTAMQTNLKDRQTAAGIGMQASGLKQSQVQTAASAAIAKSAATGDRLALRESVQQQAAQLGIAAENVMAGYLSSRLSTLTGLKISENELAQADKHWLEEIMLKNAELEELKLKNRSDASINQQEMDLRRDTFENAKDNEL